MTTTINKRAIPPPREAPNRQAIEALATATNELSGAIGDAMQRAVRVCELVDAGILALMPNGQLGRNESVDDLGIIDIDDVTGLTAALAGKVAKVGDTMTGNLTVPNLIANNVVYANGNHFVGGASFAVLSTNAGGGSVLLRPNGVSSAVGEVAINSAGVLTAQNYIQAGDGTPGVKLRIGDDAQFNDVNLAHTTALVSTSDSLKARLFLGTNRDTISNLNDGWLRLNQSGHYANGVYTPGRITASAGTINGNFDVDGGRLYIGPVSGEGGEIVLSANGGSGGAAVFDSNGDNFRWFGHPSGRVLTWDRSNGRMNVPGLVHGELFSVGGDDDILLYEGAPNQFNIRVGPPSAYKYFGFHPDGMFFAQEGIVFGGGGGWYMSDSTWIRAYGNKSVWTPATIQGNRIEATLGGLWQMDATAVSWIRQARTFVQSGDPGRAASDGDLWFW